MKVRYSGLVWALGVVVVMASVVAVHARRPTGPPADAATCSQARMLNGGKFVSRALRCAAKAASGGGKLSKACVRKAASGFAKALKKVDRVGTCAKGFEAQVSLAQFAAFADAVVSDVHPDRGRSRCDGAKLKATGDAAETLLAAVAKARQDLDMTSLGASRSSTSGTLHAAVAAAEQAGNCQNPGDVESLWLTLQNAGGLAGVVRGTVELAKSIAVPPDAQPDFVDNTATLQAQGFTVAADGSSISGPPEGASGWTAVLGDQQARLDATGSFILDLPGDGPLEGKLYHPSDASTPVARFFIVETIGATELMPAAIPLELATRGSCGMNADAAKDPPSCHSFPALTSALHPRPRLTPAQEQFCSTLWGQGMFNPDPAQYPPLVNGDLGTYPNTDPNAFQCNCQDYDGYIQTGERGDSGIKGAISYPGSTCQMQVSIGCCDNEAATIRRRVLSLVDEYHFPVLHCPDNHKGNRFCQSIRKGDLAVRVKGQVAHAGDTLEFTLAPSENVTLTVHNNGCYGETGVSPGFFNNAGGVLTGDRLSGETLKHYDVYSAYYTDSDLTYLSNADCPSSGASDKYDFTVDDSDATVIFHCTATTTTTTTCPGMEFSCATSTTMPPVTTTTIP